MAKYPSIDETGQRTFLVAPRCNVVPAANGLFSLLFKWIARCEGDTCESTNTSHGERLSRENASSEGEVNSPTCIKPKNHAESSP